jgi:hypothetical protein
VTFDLRVLNDYLEVRAGPKLLEQACCAGEWASTSPSVFRLGAVCGDRLVVHDEVTGEQLEVLHTGEAMGTARDEWVLGRVVTAGGAALTHGGSLRDDDVWREATVIPPAPRTAELMAEGMSRQTADHLCVLELALEVARGDQPGSVEMVAQHATIALMWPEVRDQAARRYIGTEQRDAWLRLAGYLPAHARGPFRALAAAGDAGLAS